MKEFEDAFSEIEFSERAEKSFKEFSNWILGISVGISALLIFQINEFNFKESCYVKVFYIIIVIISLINTLIVGFNKYLILKRDTIMGIKYGLLKKLSIPVKAGQKKKEDIIEEWDITFMEWANEFNKLSKIGKIFNICLLITLITIILTGILIIILVLNN